MFPSTLFSTGGDEINANCYTEDAETQKDLNATGKTFEQALDTFTQATHKALIAEGKTPVVWEGKSHSNFAHLQPLTHFSEMVLAHNVTLANNTLILYALVL